MRWRLLACIGVLCVAGVVVPPTSGYVLADPTTFGFTFSPPSGPPGTLVRFEGNIPPSQPPDIGYGLESISAPSAPAGCELIVGLQPLKLTITATGHVTGSFVVGNTGGCFMSLTNLGPQPAFPGVYYVLLSCHACTPAGTFTITAPSSSFAVTGGASVPVARAGAGLVVLGLVLALVAWRRAGRTARV